MLDSPGFQGEAEVSLTDPLLPFEKALEEAFRRTLASNRPAEGRMDYYGIEVTRASPDRSQVDMVWTFKAGERYCCAALGCHFLWHTQRNWEELRNRLKPAGWTPPPMTIRFQVVLEQNSVFGRRGEGTRQGEFVVSKEEWCEASLKARFGDGVSDG